MKKARRKKSPKTRRVQILDLYFDKVRERAVQTSKRLRRDLETLDYSELSQTLRAMYKALSARGNFFSFYYEFAFTIVGIEPDDVSGDFGKYLTELIRARNRHKMGSAREEGGDLKNWLLFSEVRRARPLDHETFLKTLEALFIREVVEKFNGEIEHTIYLTNVTLTLKRKQTREELKGAKRRAVSKTTKKRKRRPIKFVHKKKSKLPSWVKGLKLPKLSKKEKRENRRANYYLRKQSRQVKRQRPNAKKNKKRRGRGKVS